MQRGALTPRRRQILESIVKAYIQSGQPVGSQVLARLCHQALSPASLRHEMSTMAEEGYLSQPHTSAGRVPTLKAFQEYVRPLEAGRLSSDQAERIRGQFSGAETIEERLERCSHILTELTHGLGIAAAIPPNGLELEQIELVPLPERRVLMILVTGDHAVHNRVVTLDESLSPDELTSIRN
ncbi:MAG: heat-inducible transcription repressor HrcA, partial [Acidobacteria bacterium]|nr:heat-inducible transcription repressor HrcA [Acidobacteriota bacterium]